MKTQNEIAKELGISAMTVRNRADALQLEKYYEPVPGHIGTNTRVFSDSEVKQIRDYRGRKPGRKAKDE